MPSFTMKVYDLQWFTTFGMGYEEAAEALREDGIDTVLTQNRTDPLPGSGVDQAGYLAAFADRLTGYDDRAWVEALRRARLRVYQTTATFFDPEALLVFPDATPIDADGVPDRGFDWYRGVCPTHDGYLAWKTDRLCRVVERLEPDGIFLQFARFPGFWENWTPGYRFANADRFCFCDRCRALFAAETGTDLPGGERSVQSRFILDRVGAEWTAWRCRRLAAAIGRIATAVQRVRGGTSLMLNTLPFPSSDFGGLDARREIAAQDLALLSPWFERFELMTYLQILARPPDWIGTAVADARGHLPPDREVVCTLQVAPLYTEGMHAGRGRAADVTAGDLEAAGRAALSAGADGLVFYHWTDFLEDEAAGGRKRQILRALVRR